MGKTADFFADEDVPRARVALLLEHFSRLEDDREPWRIVYPLSEVLLLLTCATIASCDDFDEIAAFGHHHLDLLRKFAPYEALAKRLRVVGCIYTTMRSQVDLGA